MTWEVFTAVTAHIVVFWVMSPVVWYVGTIISEEHTAPNLQGWYQPIRLYGIINRRQQYKYASM